MQNPINNDSGIQEKIVKKQQELEATQLVEKALYEIAEEQDEEKTNEELDHLLDEVEE